MLFKKESTSKSENVWVTGFNMLNFFHRLECWQTSLEWFMVIFHKYLDSDNVILRLSYSYITCSCLFIQLNMSYSSDIKVLKKIKSRQHMNV